MTRQRMPDPHTTDDAPEIAAAQAGDESAFTALITRYRQPVLNFVYRLTGEAATAEDLAQEVFVRAWRALPRYRQRPDAAFATWLFQIARHAAIDALRRRKCDPLSQARGGEEDLAAQPAAGSVHDDLQRRETASRIAAAIALLPEEQRTAMILSEYEGLPDAAIAAVMSCSPKAVEARLYRARHALRTALADLLA